MASAKILDEDGTWVFIAPISNVNLTIDVKHEFNIDRITLVESTKLPRIRKRLGFPLTISECKKLRPNVLERFFSKATVFATMRLTGNGSELEDVFLSHVREEISLLTLSQLGHSRRKSRVTPCLSEEGKTGLLSYLMINFSQDSWIQQNQSTNKLGELRLDKSWINIQNEYFFSLLDIIRGKSKVSKSWQRDIRNAAILAGQSQQSSDLPKCFMWNMIALELLLTKQGDAYTEILPKRAEAFLGWVSNWTNWQFEKRIKSIYQKRCSFVHSGDRKCIEIADILFSDMLLHNVLMNIVNHQKLFKSKDALVKFSEKIEAEKILGIKSRVRPKTIKFSYPILNNDDYKKI